MGANKTNAFYNINLTKKRYVESSAAEIIVQVRTEKKGVQDIESIKGRIDSLHQDVARSA